MSFHFFDTLVKNIHFQAKMAQSAEHAIKAQTVPGSSQGQSLLFGSNLGTCVSCERIRKTIQECVITIACTSLTRKQERIKKSCSQSQEVTLRII